MPTPKHLRKQYDDEYKSQPGVRDKISQYQKGYYLKNKEKINKQNSSNYYKNREEYIKTSVKWQTFKKYGVTPEIFNEMVIKQEGKCAICKSDKPGGRGRWHIDHCHQTNKVRGLLCQRCNMGMGLFDDNPILFQQVLQYLQSF